MAAQFYSVPWISAAQEEMRDDNVSTGNLPPLFLNLKKNVAGACRRGKELKVTSEEQVPSLSHQVSLSY